MVEQNIHWNDFDRLSHEIGIVLPFSRISVKSSGRKTVLIPSWRRWPPIMCCLLIALFHVVPLIISYFVIPETSPKRPEMMSKAIPLSIFSLLWFWLTFRQMIRYGKISWQQDSSELVLYYGNLLFSHTIRISKEGLTVKICVYKADRPNIRAKYGQTMLSLVGNDQQDNELIIAVLRDEKTAIFAYQKLKNFIGNGINELSIEEPALPSDVLPLDIGDPSWNVLAKKSRTKSPFFGSMRSKSISIKSSNDNVVFKWSWTRWLILLLLVPFSGFMYFGAFFLFELTIRGIFFCAAGLGMGTFLSYPCLKVILAAEKITLNNWNSTITIRYGLFPFQKTLTTSAQKFKARIYRCNLSQANRAIKPGYTLLSLLHKKNSNSEFIIAAASKKTLITPVYERLTEFLKQPKLDELLEEVPLPEGQKIHVSKESLSGGENIGDKKRVFNILTGDTAVFSQNWTLVIMGIGLVAAMLAISIWIFIVDDNGEKSSLGVTIIFTLIALVFIAFGFGLAVDSWLTRYIVADKKNKMISYKKSIKTTGKGRIICAISDIAAIQVCSILGTITSGKSSKEVTVYEINIVLKNSDNKRINIMAGQNYPQIKNDAAQFAEFLGVPLLDHA